MTVVILVKLCIPALLLAYLLSCQVHAGTRDLYLCPGDNYHSNICLATSNDGLLYWKLNDTSIFSDSEADAFGVNISTGHDDAGRLYQTLTIPNVQDPVNVSCLEGETVIESDFIRIKDVCDPPSVTEYVDVDGSKNLANTTAGSKSELCDKRCVIAVAVMAVIAIFGITAIAVGIYMCCTRGYKCQRRDDVETQQSGENDRPPPSGQPGENNGHPPGDHDDDSGDDDDDSSGDGQGNSTAVTPEDVTEGTRHRVPGLPFRDPPRLSNSRKINDQLGPQANSTSESAGHVKAQFGIVENNDGPSDVITAGKQCTDEGGIDPIFCYENEIRGSVRGISSYNNTTYCVDLQIYSEA